MIVTNPIDVGPLDIDKSVHVLFNEGFSKFSNSRTALIDGSSGQKYSYAQIHQMAASISDILLNKYHVRKGDVISTIFENRVEWFPLLVGISATGARLSSINAEYTSYELAHLMSGNGAQYIITKNEYLEKTMEALKKVPQQVKHIFLLDPLPSQNGPFFRPFAELLSSNDQQIQSIPLDPVNDAAAIFFSSGTTGLPKGVLLSHRAINSICYGCVGCVGPALPDINDVVICVLPLFHLAGWITIAKALLNGAKVVIMPKYTVKGFAELIAAYKATFIFCVPLILINLVKDQSIQHVDLSSIQKILFGASPAGAELIQALRIKFPQCKRFAHAYGMTEVGLATGVPQVDPEWTPLTSIGSPVPGVEIKVVSIDGSNKILGPNESGELWIRGPGRMIGYQNRPKETSATVDSDGFVHSGDIGYYDNMGFFYITDRLKELIKYKSFQVAPAEVEDLLLGHPAVADVGIAGIPDPINPDVGELPTAFVVVADGIKEDAKTANDIKSHVARNLANYKQLRGGVYFVKELPRSGSGKVLRRILKELVKEGTIKAKL